MNIEALYDPASVAIVVGGTLLATMLRSGRTEWRAARHLCLRLACAGFNRRKARARLASSIAAIQRDGVHRTDVSSLGDGDLVEATAALIRHRSLAAFVRIHERQQADRARLRRDAVRLLVQAGELAPVFGLAGTLLALSQVTGHEGVAGGPAETVAMAILTTLYGLILAHIVLLPLARLIERRGEREEAERQLLADWLLDQLRDAMPHARTPSVPQAKIADRKRRAALIAAEQDRAA